MKLKVIRRISVLVCKFVLYTFCATLARSPHPDLINRIKVDKLAPPHHLLHPSNYQERGINSSHKKRTVPPSESKPVALLLGRSAQGDLAVIWDEKNDNRDESSGGIYFCKPKTKNSQDKEKVILPE